MIVKLIVDGGAMKPGPSVAQQLGPMGINLGKVIEDVNKATTGFKGMKVPVAIDVDPKTKQYTISVSSPPIAELLKKAANAEKGSGSPLEEKIGNLSIEQIISIAKTKMPDMLAKNLKNAVKLTVGSCVSIGMFIENKEPKHVMQEIEQGVYDKEINHEKTEPSPEKLKDLAVFFKDRKAAQEAAAKAKAAAAAAAEEAAKAAEAAAPKAAVPAVPAKA